MEYVELHCHSCYSLREGASEPRELIVRALELGYPALALTLLLLLRWAKAPSTGRLFAFFAVYALGFGNHLSMILLLPGYTLFLLMAAPRGWRSPAGTRASGPSRSMGSTR